MQPEQTRVDEAVLALLAIWSFPDGPAHRAWKSFDWASMNRLNAAGFIADPRGKAKSVVLTPEGLERGLALARQLFSSE